MKAAPEVKIFVASQICGCSTDPGCCSAPGQSEKEIADLVSAVKNALGADKIEVNDLRIVAVIDKYPEAARLFKEHGYNGLPLVMLEGEIIAYGIPDAEFIINAIRKHIKHA